MTAAAVAAPPCPSWCELGGEHYAEHYATVRVAHSLPYDNEPGAEVLIRLSRVDERLEGSATVLCGTTDVTVSFDHSCGKYAALSFDLTNLRLLIGALTDLAEAASA